MKQFTNIKIGYTSGIYGCSNELFVCIYFNKKGMGSFCFKGMYGAEERVSRLMQDKGYKEVYTPSDYGKMRRKEADRAIFLYDKSDLLKKRIKEV